MRRAVIALAVATALSGCGGDGGGARRDPKPAAEVGRVAPTFATTDLSGKKIRLADYRGQTVIVNFWASWCIPCRTEFPLLAELDARDDVAVLGVVFNDTVANAAKFMRERKASWPGLKDDGSIAKAYRVGPGMPVSVVIGPDGVVTVRHVGEFTKPEQLVPSP